MPEQYVFLDRRDDGVAVVRLDRPKANALSLAMLAQLEDVAHGLADDPPGSVVLWGGDRIFAAGADVKEFGGPKEAEAINRTFRSALDAVAAIPRAVIAAVSGYALGGGCELACACDLRVMADTARLGQPEILLGVIPGGGGTQRLTRLIGPSRAKDLILTGRMVASDEALSIGLADRVVPAEQVFIAAAELAAELAAGPLAAHALAKEAIDGGLDRSLSDGLDLEGVLFARSFESDDAKIGIRSFLAEGPGKAHFTGH
ncbi:MAG TPA: enoyl-CoA hydratase-related protein [Acidimicrobiales bacterium]|jgi:enoyl-CoA hydratase|nr:enoyl-CoA hydratase-related protein [Acidimicrobiales bacterium]